MSRALMISIVSCPALWELLVSRSLKILGWTQKVWAQFHRLMAGDSSSKEVRFLNSSAFWHSMNSSMVGTQTSSPSEYLVDLGLMKVFTA
jgi:hypothetical protein